MENLWIWVVVALLLWQGLTLLQFFTFLYYRFELPRYQLQTRDEIEEQVWKIVEPYEHYLLEKGFIFKYLVVYPAPIVGSTLLVHKFYYYHEVQGVHAFLETTPYKGSLQSVRIAYDSIYESRNICTTENGMEHYIPVIPSEVSFFDHYFASWEEVYEAHLIDRAIEGEVVTKEAFSKEGWLHYMEYSDNMYINTFAQAGVIKRTETQYRYLLSFALWKFSKKVTNGYRKYSKILKEKRLESGENRAVKSHHVEGVMVQMEQTDKPRGKSANKRLWFAGSLIVFVLLFGLVGFSISEIIILVIVLLIHELGHFLAMRYFGYTDTSIFFLPFGAATIGKKEKRKAYEEYIVSLMGPLPGLLIGIGLILYALFFQHHFSAEGYLGMYAMMSLLINYINLLPIYPLDGGRILQTLLLLRYPKGQFYFYLVGLAILIVAMLWMRDPFLLIFVILLALGLKQSYKISQLLQKLFSQSRQEKITKQSVATVLMEDEIFSKETLSSKASIAKQAMMIIDTTKPSKIFLVFGLGFYLLLLSPPMLLLSFGVHALVQSDYSQLSNTQREEVTAFYSKVNSFKVLRGTEEKNLSLSEAMQRLDVYFQEHNLSQAKPFEGEFSTVYPCRIPKEVQTLYRWHNGVKYLLGDENIYSAEELYTNYNENIKPYPYYDKKWIALSTQYTRNALGILCDKKGFFYYTDEENSVKTYYSLAHLLTVSADAFEEDAYFYSKESKSVYVDARKLHAIKEKYLSLKDKEQYEMLYLYLEKKAKEYQKSTNPYFKRLIIWEMQSLGKKRFLPYLKMYSSDANKEIAQIAKSAIETLLETEKTLLVDKVTVKIP